MERQSMSSFAQISPAATSPLHDSDATMIATHSMEFRIEYEMPLYTEINIPLPRLSLPSSSTSSKLIQPSATTPSLTALPASKSRGRSRSLSSLSLFHRLLSSSSALSDSFATIQASEEWPRVRKDVVKSREVYTMMDLRHQNKRGRSRTIEALAVVPAVLVLSVELFTPKEGGRKQTEGSRKDSGAGGWEDGIR